MSHLLLVVAALQAEAIVPPPTNNAFLFWVATRPEDCNLQVAKKVTLEAFSQRPDDWVGKCVAISGYRYGRALFKSPLDARARNSGFSDELNGHRVGIYGRPEVLKPNPKQPKRLFAVGVAETCERLSKNYTMAVGYCHNAGGPVLVVAELRRR